MLGKTVRVPRHVELSEPGWRRADPPLTSSFSPKLVQRFWKFVENGRYRVKKTGNAYNRFPIWILLWAPSKMQRFCCEPHRLPSFSTGRALGPLLKRQQNHSQHLVPGCRLTG